jgi:hypothetical protein
VATRSTRTKLTGTAAVEVWLDASDHPHLDAIRALRRLILQTDSRLCEDVKWNAPSFFLAEGFDDHVATLRVAPRGVLQVILHLGAAPRSPPPALAGRVPDPAGVLRWAAPDRASVDFADLQGVTEKGPAFAALLQAWVAAACALDEAKP